MIPFLSNDHNFLLEDDGLYKITWDMSQSRSLTKLLKLYLINWPNNCNLRHWNGLHLIFKCSDCYLVNSKTGGIFFIILWYKCSLLQTFYCINAIHSQVIEEVSSDEEETPPEGKQDDVIKWKHFPRYWPFVRGIHRSPVNYPHKGQWRGALMFSLICVWINGWLNNRETGDLRPYRVHYDVTVMTYTCYWCLCDEIQGMLAVLGHSKGLVI